MKPEQWQQINRLYHSALEREPAWRGAFLDEACAGDEWLRREVEGLIAANEQAGSFIELPAYAVAAEMLIGEKQSLVGASISHYKIIELLGVGGMGEVYLAQDTTVLDRTVAIKVLPPAVASDPKRMQRFVQEAKTVSALNHPNILTIHESGQEGATSFIVTEHVDGSTLREYLRPSQRGSNSLNTLRPKLHDVLEITAQIAAALDAAHEAKVVHRDIKPENVMIRSRDAIVKVLDFGLAKTTEESVAGQIDSEARTRAMNTEPGVVVGTVIYMSPEQSAGSARVDHRTDIWSLGVVLYEMIAGRVPFAGTDVHRQIIAIQETNPPPLSRYAEGVPDGLEVIVAKALAKDPNQRYQTAKDLLIDLRNLSRKLEVDAEIERTAPPEFRSVKTSSQDEITVVTASGSAPATARARTANASNAQYIVSGIKRHKLAAAGVLAIVTVAAVAFFFYHNRAPALTEKDTILLTDFTNTTGDVVFDGTLKQGLAVHLGQSPFLNLFGDDRVRETLRLMNLSPDERVTPVIGREICQRKGVKAMLTGSIASLGRNYVISLEAVNAQTGDVLAREQSEAEGKEQVLRSLGEAATRLREKLGESLSSIQKFDAPLEQATTSSLEAFRAFSLGIEQILKGKYFEAISSNKHAIELDPNFAFAYIGLVAGYYNTGQPGLAAEAAQKAFELREHVSEREKLRISYRYYLNVTGEINKSIEAMELYKQTYPRDSIPRTNLGAQYASLGQYKKAIEEYREAVRLNPSSSLTLAALSDVLMRLNRFEEAKAMGDQSITQGFDGTRVHNVLYNLAFINGDGAAMQQQVDWAKARPGEYAHLKWQADSAGFAGQWQKARELNHRATDLTEQRELGEEAEETLSSKAELA
ncbi:MAG TPA: tetratricopeptide repeat-containing serine/threonine-protein kinase, partial [Pyrinomonadaceae bacterium]|nr:tetratricopeptide repeat-containing serine/threonine-protein kinase [Pyrinomonadaceae bacterium]